MKRIPMRVVLLTTLALLAGCASKMSVAELAIPEVILETLPASAEVSVDGTPRGRTPLVLQVRPEQASFAVELRGEGFHPRSVRLDAAELREMAGQRILLVLSPASFELEAKPIEPDDVGQLGRAGVTLVREGRCPEALQYFRHALVIDPRLPIAHKGMGTCYAQMKRTREALAAYKQYLLYAPDAPDAKRVQEIVSRAEGDIIIPEK